MPRPIRAVLCALAVLCTCIAAPAGASAAPAAGGLVTVSTPSVARGGIQVQWRTNVKLASATLTLNGHRIAAASHLRLKGARSRLPLDAADGVRFGTNRLVATVAGPGGRRQIVRRTLVVRRDTPLPAVQTHGARVARRAIRLDGRRTLATSHPLSYRWRVVRAPRGAKAKLTGALTTTPRLVGSLPGRYTIALTVRQRARAGRAPAFAGSAASSCSVPGSAPSGAVPAGPSTPVASTPASQLPAASISVVAPTSATTPTAVPASTAQAGCATQVESVDVGVNALPIGIAIDTNRTVRGVPSIVVGDQSYPLPAAGGGAAAVLFDAATMEQLAFVSPLDTNLGITQVSALGAAELLAQTYLQKGEPVLLVAAGVAGCCASDSQDSAAGFSAIETWGSTSGTPSPSVNEGHVLGGAEGTAGEQVGWLQLGVPLDGADALYTFVSPDRATFDTQAASTASSNTMQVNGTSYYGALPPGSTAGYQVLVLDASLTPQLGTPTTYGTVGTGGASEEQTMSQLLQQASTLPGSTTLIQSINSPSPQSPNAVASGAAITALGGTSWMFLSGGAQYSLVGNPAPSTGTTPITPWAAETQSGWTAAASNNQGGGNGTLSGVLRRRGDSAWASAVQSAIGDTAAAPNFGLSGVAVQPAVPWPQDATPGQIEATTWIAEQLGLVPGPGSCWQPAVPDVRSSYCNTAINWNSMQTSLDNLTYPASSKPTFSLTDFTNVQKQLSIEMGDVGSIESLIATLQEPFTSTDPKVAVNAQSIAGNVIGAIKVPLTGNGTSDLSIAASILEAASIVPGAGEVLGPIGSALDIAAETTQSDGVSVPYWQVQGAADTVGAQMSSRLTSMSDSLGNLEEILVSDWGRMSAAVTGADGPWGISYAGLSAQQSVMELGVQQAMWSAILPAGFTLYSFPGYQNAAAIECVTSEDAHFWNPWGSSAGVGNFLPLNAWNPALLGGGAASTGVLAMLSGGVDSDQSTPLNSTLAGQIFGAPGQGGAGVIQPWLYTRANWTIVKPPTSGENLECQTAP